MIMQTKKPLGLALLGSALLLFSQTLGCPKAEETETTGDASTETSTEAPTEEPTLDPKATMIVYTIADV